MEPEQLAELALAAHELEPEARSQLLAELKARHLAPGLWEAIERFPELTPRELTELVDWVQWQPCPWCGRIGESLNAYMGTPTASMLQQALPDEAPPEESALRKGAELAAKLALAAGAGVVLTRVKQLVLGCQDCLSASGAWRLFRLKPGKKWKPTPEIRKHVQRFAPFFIAFRERPEVIRALLLGSVRTLWKLAAQW